MYNGGRNGTHSMEMALVPNTFRVLPFRVKSLDSRRDEYFSRVNETGSWNTKPYLLTLFISSRLFFGESPFSVTSPLHWQHYSKKWIPCLSLSKLKCGSFRYLIKPACYTPDDSIFYVKGVVQLSSCVSYIKHTYWPISITDCIRPFHK